MRTYSMLSRARSISSVANLPYLPAAEAAFFSDLATEPGEAVFAEGNSLEPYRGRLALAPIG